MNKGRWASIRLVARRSVCSAVDVSVILVSFPWSAITRLNLRPASKVGLLDAGRKLSRVIALQGITRLNLRPASKVGLLVEGTVRKNWTACLEPRGLRPKAAEKRLVLQGVGQMGRRKYKSLLAVRPVEVPPTLRDYSSGSPEFEG